jgi:hypothetical protein
LCQTEIRPLVIDSPTAGILTSTLIRKSGSGTDLDVHEIHEKHEKWEPPKRLRLSKMENRWSQSFFFSWVSRTLHSLFGK